MNVRAERSTTIVRASPAATAQLELDAFGGGDVQLARQPDRVDVTEKLGVHAKLTEADDVGCAGTDGASGACRGGVRAVPGVGGVASPLRR